MAKHAKPDNVVECVADPDDLPKFLTVQEAAELLRTTSKALYGRIQRGQMPAVCRLGRQILISRDRLLRSLDESRAPSLEVR